MKNAMCMWSDAVALAHGTRQLTDVLRVVPAFGPWKQARDGESIVRGEMVFSSEDGEMVPIEEVSPGGWYCELLNDVPEG